MRQKIALCKWQFKRSKVISIVLGRCDLLSPGWLSWDFFFFFSCNATTGPGCTLRLLSHLPFTSFGLHPDQRQKTAAFFNCFGSFSHHFVCSGLKSVDRLVKWGKWQTWGFVCFFFSIAPTPFIQPCVLESDELALDTLKDALFPSRSWHQHLLKMNRLTSGIFQAGVCLFVFFVVVVVVAASSNLLLLLS